MLMVTATSYYNLLLLQLLLEIMSYHFITEETGTYNANLKIHDRSFR